MKSIVTTLVFFSALLWGCASQEEKLSQEYQQISSEIDALLEERKALVDLEMATKDYLKAKQKQEEERGKYDKIREQNSQAGLPLGKEVPRDLPPQEKLQVIKKNDDALSDRIHALKERRKKIVQQQSELKN